MEATTVTYTPSKDENTKKTASAALENAITRVKTHLMDVNPKILKRFNQVLDRTKREITSARAGDDSLKRIYPVQLAAEFAVLRPLIEVRVDPASTADQLAASLVDMDEGEAWLTHLGFSLRNVVPNILKNELPVISALNEDEMKKNVYLGRDMSKKDA